MKVDRPLQPVTWKPACLFQQHTTCAHTAPHLTPENKQADCGKLMDTHAHTLSHTLYCIVWIQHILCSYTSRKILFWKYIFPSALSPLSTRPPLQCSFLSFIPISFAPLIYLLHRILLSHASSLFLITYCGKRNASFPHMYS